MKKIVVKCDRCGNQIEGAESECGTCGFYVLNNSLWGKYSKNNEVILCDNCMWKDDHYREDYPHI